MLRKGTSVKIKYPEYVTGVTGKIVTMEDSSKRWIVCLDKNPFKDSQEIIYLSLEESDFEVIK